jgi:hypothetical protein
MPFDPLSVLGIVGTTAGLLGFLVSTVENITVRLNNYKECVKKLQEYNHKLESVFLEMQLWSRLWSEHRNGCYTPYSDESYSSFWGPVGFEGIISRSENIRTEIQAITELLECRNIRNSQIDWRALGRDIKCPTEDHINSWSLLLSLKSEPNNSLSGFDEKMFYRFLFSIYRNTELNNRVTNLQQCVSELGKISISLFRTKHEARKEAPNPDQVSQTAAFTEKRMALLSFLDELHQDNQDSSVHWEFVLGVPSLKRAISSLRGMSKPQLEFLFRGRTATDVYDARIAYPKFRKLQRYEILETIFVGSDEQLDDNTKRNQKYSPYEQLQLHTLPTLGVEEMSTYALAAVAAARSTILLYRCSLVEGLCFCGINLYGSHEKDKRLAYLRNPHCAHVGYRARTDTFLLLAIFLAELAVGAPIRVQDLNSSFLPEQHQFEIPEEFLLPGFSGWMDWDTLSDLLSERMYEVPEQFVSVEYLEAMDYCYQLSQRLRSRDFVNDDLDICIARIETP